MDKLTKAENAYLAAMPDWASIPELRRALGLTLDEGGRTYNAIEKMARRLCARGLAEHHAPNNTYRIVGAGRAALKDKHHG